MATVRKDCIDSLFPLNVDKGTQSRKMMDCSSIAGEQGWGRTEFSYRLEHIQLYLTEKQRQRVKGMTE